MYLHCCRSDITLKGNGAIFTHGLKGFSYVIIVGKSGKLTLGRLYDFMMKNVDNTQTSRYKIL